MTNLAAYEAALEPLGHSVTVARSGDEALAKLLEQDFALIVMDMSMPGLSGLETARLIRGRPRSRNTPLVFITGLTWTDDLVVDAYRLGALDFMTKPIAPEVLRAKMSLFLQLQHRPLELSKAATEIVESEPAATRGDVENVHRDELIAVLGHELRNPLAIMSSALDVVELREGSLSRELVLVQRQIRHLSNIVTDLVDASRLRFGTIRIRPATVHVVAALAEAIESVQPLIETRGHALEIDVDHEITVTADPERIVQALAKVLDNAARYTPTGGQIKVTATRDGAFVQIVVADTGNGLEADLLQRVFDPFVQGPRGLERSAGGLGLGLSLVRSLVELHGGSVKVASPGARLGTTLTLSWPAAPAVLP